MKAEGEDLKNEENSPTGRKERRGAFSTSISFHVPVLKASVAEVVESRLSGGRDQRVSKKKSKRKYANLLTLMIARDGGGDITEI